MSSRMSMSSALARNAQELVDPDDLAVDINKPLDSADLFEATGVCVFPDIFPVRLMDDCSACLVPKFQQLDEQLKQRGISVDEPFRFNEVCRRRFGRYDTRGFGLDGAPFSDNLLGQENPLLPFVRAVLGDDCVELWRGVVDNRAGSSDQSWHRDGTHLFEHTHLPTHCLTVFIPLVDITDSCGPTQFYPGSHAAWRAMKYSSVNDGAFHLPECTPLCGRGSVIAFDYRTIHRGTANSGEASRPIFYIVFARPWFKDHNNFPTDHPLFCAPGDSSATRSQNTAMNAQ